MATPTVEWADRSGRGHTPEALAGARADEPGHYQHVYLLLASGVINIGGQGSVGGYLALAFVAGFSERLGQDLVIRAEHVLTAADKAEPAARDNAGPKA